MGTLTRNLANNLTNSLGKSAVSGRNLVINGDMDIAQRTTSAVTINSGSLQYPVDRFAGRGTSSAGVFTVEQDTEAPENFNNSVKLSTATYFVTSLFGIVLYLQIFSLYDLNILGKFSVYQTICFFGSKLISLSTPYSLMKNVSHAEKAKINLNHLISAFFIVLFVYMSIYVLFSIDNIFIFFEKIPYIEVVILLSTTIFLQAVNFLIKTIQHLVDYTASELQ